MLIHVWFSSVTLPTGAILKHYIKHTYVTAHNFKSDISLSFVQESEHLTTRSLSLLIAIISMPYHNLGNLAIASEI